MANKNSIAAIVVSLLSLCCSAGCLVYAMNADNHKVPSDAPAAVRSGDCSSGGVPHSDTGHFFVHMKEIE